MPLSDDYSLSEADTALSLGFASVEEYHAWHAAGSPTGQCSNEKCRRPAHWPDMPERCPHCGWPLTVTTAAERGPNGH